MDKLKMHTPNQADENYRKLAALFPNAVTETIDEATGEVVRAIDKDVLLQEISARVVEGREERYQFTWPDKKKAMLAANAPIAATLRPVRADSVGRDGMPAGWDSQNLYIEGDNLDVLKLLQETYLSKVKMIYIDPPYNTGNDFVYEDDFAEEADEYLARSGQFDEQGNRLEQNTESNGRFHTDWLNMIYCRLKLAKNLLTNDGVIAISIDDNEIDNLRRLCDEVFGERNLINCFVWNCSTAGGIRPKYASKTHEYLLAYARDIDCIPMLYAPLSEGAKRMYTQQDSRGAYRDKDFVFKNKSTNQNQMYLIECPDGEKVKPKEGYIYRFIRERFVQAMSEGLVTFKKTKTGPLVTENGEQANWNIYIKKYLGDAMGAPSTLISNEKVSFYNSGTSCVQDLFNGLRVFENCKPVDFIEYFVSMMGEKDCIVLDFFSGSATTAHAVMQLNAEDGGHRRFIMVQLPEQTDEKSEAYRAGYKTICDIGKERIRRAGRKIKKEAGLSASDLDIGFRVLRLDSSNMQDVYYNPAALTQDLLAGLEDNIKSDRTPEDLLFQVMLDLGVELSSTIQETVIDGKKVFDVAEGFLLACFDKGVSTETVTAIAKKKPYYAVFRDSSMENDSVATNFDQIFETYSPQTTRKVL